MSASDPGGGLQHRPWRTPLWADTPSACWYTGQQAGGTHTTGMHSCGCEIGIGLEILTQFQLVPIHRTVLASSSFISVVESEKMNNKFWTLCEEQKVEIRQHKQETSKLNRELVQVRYIIESIYFRLPRNICRYRSSCCNGFKRYTRFWASWSSLGITNGNRSHNKPLELI